MKINMGLVADSRLSRREFLKLLGAGAMVGVLGKFANFMPQNIQSQSLIREASSTSLGSWAVGPNLSIAAIHATLLRNGKIMYVAGSGWQHNNKFGPFKGAVFDPITNSELITTFPTDDLFCCNFSQLANGNILIAGGTKDYDDLVGSNGIFHGGNFAYEFDVTSSNFIKLHPMAHGRWYPSMGTLPNGKVFVMTGFDEYGAINELTEVYDPTFKTFSIKYDPTSSRTYCVGGLAAGPPLPGAGNPCYGGTNKGVGPIPPDGPTAIYSRTIIMPSGLVFKGGQSKYLNTWNPTTGQFVSAGKMGVSARTYGAAVLLPLHNDPAEKGKVLLAAGKDNTNILLNSAEIVNFDAGTNTTPIISPTTSMTYPRMYTLPVMLPTGHIIIFGGSAVVPTSSFVLYPEMFDPLSNTWTVLPPATVPRTYHSVALLLPDGRVWTASGTTTESSFEARTEIFTPWYYSSTRPTIPDSPPSPPIIVGPFGGTITIPTPDASSITAVSLVRLPNTTHHIDWEHRLIWLQIQGTTSSSVTVSAPINANIAPPGYYLIHVLKNSGNPAPFDKTPSAGKIIQIGASVVGAPDTTPPTIGIYSPSARAPIVGPVSGVTVNVAGTAFDSSGIQSVVVSIDGGPSSQANPGPAGDWSTWSFPAFINTMGPHTIEAIATDNAGNKASVKIPVTVFL